MDEAVRSGPIYTIDLLEEALQLARACGYQIRMEPLGGAKGGLCRLAGCWIVMLDPRSTPVDHLEILADCLPWDSADPPSPALRRWLQRYRDRSSSGTGSLQVAAG
jgi:hypothetical protein